MLTSSSPSENQIKRKGEKNTGQTIMTTLEVGNPISLDSTRNLDRQYELMGSNHMPLLTTDSD
jgi:hypothetical protein